jgi:hypothetical protein
MTSSCIPGFHSKSLNLERLEAENLNVADAINQTGTILPK